MTSPSENEGVQPTPSHSADPHVQSLPDAPHAEAGHEHGHAPAPEGPYFSEQEWKELQDDDVHAGGAIVALMASIFTIGLMLYATIALIASTSA
jgi:hypothetical protein